MSAGGGDYTARMTTRANQFSRPALAVLIIDPDLENAERLAKAINARCAVAVTPNAQAARTDWRAWSSERYSRLHLRS